MDSKTYRTRQGTTRYRPVITADELSTLDTTGFCLACGEECSGVEPDARQYACESCGEASIYGLEELVMLGIAVIIAAE